MAYIGPDGSVSDRKPRARGLIDMVKGIVRGVYDFFNLFFSSFTGNPAQISVNSNGGGRNSGNGNPYRPNRTRGANIRTARNLGTANAPAGGG
mmetsp:Transcript_15977/g.23377  ORF Transcript_15977/g.23377 Transcript_15977/m.23377 type:complete len:93 (+) Transcript_15977:115-393(+)|eukprot:CAMPEP_0197246898 /NCGR_PEP_ID=MMETSP1429-20130617/23527_1 /TAXON_ID=49237 /ORGANISM="Chaetoceros  sp., Strain UNC1202" /LENGTH=92 /DNA_ID=CAMNT_0042707669 /DNA_START=97 /DNA_END=375 /DNA_ORIENTATION=-